jgi:hypothetical protein
VNRIRRALRSFLFPPPGSRLSVRLLPYAVLGVLTLLVLGSSVYAWEYTNSPEFAQWPATMPPEYTAYLTSPHARTLAPSHRRDFIATHHPQGGDIHIISLAFQD